MSLDLPPTACPDWESRLKLGLPPMAEDRIDLFSEKADKFSSVLSRLVVADIQGQPEIGTLDNFEWIDLVARALYGGEEVREALVLVAKKNAKALALDTEVATSEGFRSIGSLGVGDRVLDADGKVTQVTHLSEVFHDHDCYRVRLSTGEEVIADAGHRWFCGPSSDDDGTGWRFRTTEEIAAEPAGKYRLRNPPGLELDWRMTRNEPYRMGRALMQHKPDAKMRSTVRYLLARGRVGEDGAIPEEFLRASSQQRFHLMRGLLVDQGKVLDGETPKVALVARSAPQAYSLHELAHTLGFPAQVISRVIRDVRRYVVVFEAGCDDMLFGDSRDALLPPGRFAAAPHFRGIESVTPVPSVPTKCIKVASSTEQFLITRSLIPTGNTSFGALVVLAAFLVNKIHMQSFTILAPTVGIASFTFDQIRGAITADPELGDRTTTRRHVREIEHLETEATIAVKPASLDAVTGLRGHVFVDELHLWGAMRQGQKLRQQLRGALAVNKECRGLYITTQSDSPPTGVFGNMLNYAREVRDGKIIDPSFLPVLYEPWEGYDPWTDETYWSHLLPSYPHIADRQFYRQIIQEAEKSGPTAISEGKSQYFNIEIGSGQGGQGWDVAERFDALQTDVTLDELIEDAEVLAVGVDLGGASDLSSLVVLALIGAAWVSWGRSWLTQTGWDRNGENESRFTKFKDAGDLRLILPGGDVQEITEICVRCRDSGKMRGVGIDPAGAADLVDALEAAGFMFDEDMFGVGQSAFRLAPAVRTIERRAERGSILFARQGIMGYALSNVVVKQRGNAPSITKEYALGKIDPVAALLDAASVMISERGQIGSIDHWVA